MLMAYEATAISRSSRSRSTRRSSASALASAGKSSRSSLFSARVSDGRGRAPARAVGARWSYRTLPRSRDPRAGRLLLPGPG